MRFGTLLLVIWLVIGAIAAGQRGYYSGSIGSCTQVGTIAVTIIAGPLNYWREPQDRLHRAEAQPVRRGTASGLVQRFCWPP